MIKNYIKVLTLSTLLSVPQVFASSGAVVESAEKESYHARQFLQGDSPHTLQVDKWWGDWQNHYRANSSKMMADYVKDLATRDAEAATWFLATGGKFGFANRAFYVGEEDTIKVAVSTVARAFSDRQKQGDNQFQRQLEAYKQQAAATYGYLVRIEKEVIQLRVEVKALRLEVAQLKDTLAKNENSFKAQLQREREDRAAEMLKAETVFNAKLAKTNAALVKERSDRLADKLTFEAKSLAFEERLETARKKHVEQDMALEKAASQAREEKLKAEHEAALREQVLKAEAQKAEYEAKILGLEVTRVTKELDKSLSKIAKIKEKNGTLVEKLENLMKQQQLDQSALEKKSELEKKIEELTKREEKKVEKAGEYIKKYRDIQDQYASLQEKFDSEKEVYKALDTKYAELSEKFEALTHQKNVQNRTMQMLLEGDLKKAANKDVQNITEKMNQKRAMNRIQQLRARSASPINRSRQSYESSFTSSESSDSDLSNSSNYSTFSLSKRS